MRNNMKITTYEGFVENGCVHVSAGVELPEKAKVYIIVPETYEIGVPRTAHVPSPRLAHPEQAKDFVKEVFEIKEEK
jgi:hypothetical protein